MIWISDPQMVADLADASSLDYGRTLARPGGRLKDHVSSPPIGTGAPLARDSMDIAGNGPKIRCLVENRYDFGLKLPRSEGPIRRLIATIMQPPPRKSMGTRPAERRLALAYPRRYSASQSQGECTDPTPGGLHARFLQWLRSATGFADLPADAARTCLELLFRSGITPESLSALEPDSYRGTPFEKRLLEAWYTGLFQLDGLSEMRSFDTTLMWRAAGMDPPPSSCSGGPESWASAPSNI